MQTPTRMMKNITVATAAPMLGSPSCKLVAEEGAVEERAENVGGEIRPGQRALDRVDEIEGVEVADEGEDRDQPDGRQDQRQLDVPEDAQLAEAVDARGVNQILGNVEQRGVDQHHRDADELPDGDQRQGDERGRRQAEPGREQRAEADRLQRALGDAPERRQDEVPGEADDDDRQHRRQEDQRAIEAAQPQVRQAQQPRQRDADRVLHQHVHDEEFQVVPAGVPERPRPDRDR